MIFYELVEKDFRNRGNIVPVTELEYKVRDYKAFISLFGYGDQVKEWVEVNGSVKGYDKDFHLETFYFDIDNEDLSKSLDDTKYLLKLLYRNYSVKPSQLDIYFSGNKGFHIGMPSSLFGGFQPSNQLPYQIKALARNLVQDKVNVDYSIYKPNIMFRLPDSQHGKSELFKVPLYSEELGKGIDYIVELAEYPRPEFEKEYNLNDIVVNRKLKNVWQRSQHTADEVNSEDKMSLKDGGFFKPVTKYRNNTYFKQAAMLFDKKLGSGEVLDIIKSINEASGKPLPDNEVYTLVRSAARKTKAKQNVEKVESKSSRSLVSDLIPNYLDYLSPSNRKLSLLFPTFSKDTKHKLRGKLIGVFGTDGTKKSLYCQNLIYKNMRKYGARTILSNMEMGDNALMDRIVDRTLNEYNDRPSSDLENLVEAGRDDLARKKLDMIAKHYANKLIIHNQSSMTPDDYRKLIDAREQEFGKVDILVVDGFSMMGGATDQYQQQIQNSKELKEIAKDMDIAVVSIFHTNAECRKWYRRADRYVRGVSKQLDNVDMTISMSLLIDEENSQSHNDLYYRNDLGYATMYNKRGTGNVLRLLYKFKSERLAMAETDLNPTNYEINPNKLRSHDT